MNSHRGLNLCFGDLPELDGVIAALSEWCELANHPKANKLWANSPIPVLLSRVEAQAVRQRERSEDSHPGAFDRSYLAEEYVHALDLLATVMHYPWELPETLSQIERSLHRVMILGNLSEEELTRTLTLAETGWKKKEAGDKGRRNGARKSNPSRDKAIFEAVEAARNADRRKPDKQIFPEVGKSFGIRYDAVNKAIGRHKRRGN